jgi:hypothetical protein
MFHLLIVVLVLFAGIFIGKKIGISSAKNDPNIITELEFDDSSYHLLQERCESVWYAEMIAGKIVTLLEQEVKISKEKK